MAEETLALLVNSAVTRTEDEKEQNTAQESAGPFGCFVWCCSSSSTCSDKCQCTMWITFGLLAPIFYGVYLDMDSETIQINWGYFLCCALSLLLSMYATWNFSAVLNLKQVIDDLVKNTRLLNQLRTRIQQEVGNLKDVRDKLSQIEQNESMNNAKLRAKNRQFKQWSQTSFTIIEKNNKKSLRIKDDLQISIQKQKREIIRSEISILYNAHKHFEYSDDNIKGSGLNRFEFENLINALPKRYKIRFRKSKKLFDDFANVDDIIDHNQFRKFLDDIVIDEVNQLSNIHSIHLPAAGIFKTE